MLANIFDPVQKCCANWPTRSNMYQHSPTSTNIRQQGEQTFPTCCANNVGAMLANVLRWFKPAFTNKHCVTTFFNALTYFSLLMEATFILVSFFSLNIEI